MGKHRTLDRDKVLEAARQIIIRDGTLRDLSFQTLAKELDIRSQSLYNYFHNLDEVIETLGAEFMNELYQRLVERLTGVSGREALKIYAETAHDFFDDAGPMMELIYFIHNYPDSSPFVQATGKLISLLRRLVTTVKLRQMDTSAFVQAFISSVLGFTVLEIMGFLPDKHPSRKTSFQELLGLYLDEAEPASI